MATIWIYRINVIAPVTDQAALNALWTVIAPEGDSEADTFGVPLSGSGSNPVTHLGISTAATEEMRIKITQTFAEELANCTISVQPYTENDWDALLLSEGLKVIEVEIL